MISASQCILIVTIIGSVYAAATLNMDRRDVAPGLKAMQEKLSAPIWTTGADELIAIQADSVRVVGRYPRLEVENPRGADIVCVNAYDHVKARSMRCVTVDQIRRLADDSERDQ